MANFDCQLRIRERSFYGIAMLAVMAAGLSWRAPSFALSSALKKYGGDALWSWLIYLGLRFLLPSSARWRCATGALAFSTAIECSQLYHAPWLDAIRATRPGALILGSTFNWPDLAAYLLGITIGWLLDERLVGPSLRQN